MSSKYKSGKDSTKAATWITVGVLVATTLGIIVLGLSQSPSSDGTGAGALAPAITDVDWKAGAIDAKVSVIEYGDFQCPACGAYHPIVKRLIDEYKDRVIFVYRDFPLDQVHENARIAAQAAEAAGLQGKYWEMHNLLFEKQNSWSLLPFGIGARGSIESIASSLGLDMDKFRSDIDSNGVKENVNADAAGGEAASVNHTPTFFVNLKQIKNPAGYDEFKSIIDQALAETS